MRSPNREFRLLDLLPGVGDEAIRCATRVVSLDRHPDYETVSYVWGDRREEKDIEVSGNLVPITENLYAGLRRLRYSTKKRTLWIDQICINQWDLEEKAAQVALMRDIYRKCTRCVTWMGDLERDGYEVQIRDAEAVFDFLRQVAAAKIIPLGGLPVLFQQSDEGSAARKAFEMFSMYGNPWWSRIWTVQEAIIPRSGVLIWGPLSIPRKAVLAAARHLRDLQSLPSLPEGFASHRYANTELLRRLLYPVHGFNHSKTDNALSLLMRWRHREFTDPRDKVYALLGMISPDAIPSARSCDYTLATPRLFAQVTLDLIKYEGGLRSLLAACEMPHITPNTPTWAIDFACCNRIGKRQLKWWGHSHRYKVFSASGDNELEVFDSLGDEVLGLSGVNVDEVLDTSELLRVDAQDAIYLHDLHEPLANCILLIDRYRASQYSSQVYKDGLTWDSAFCRTLVGDLIMDELPIDRIGSYGRARLQADFTHLFDKLGIQLDTKIHLDFAKEIPLAEEQERGRIRDHSEGLRLRGENMATEAIASRKMKNWHLRKQEHDVFPDLYESLVGMMENQTFFITKSGYIGIGPPQVKPGDQVWVFNGGNVPFVMRKIEKEAEECPQLALVGDAYVHGIMDGEALNDEPHVQNICVH